MNVHLIPVDEEDTVMIFLMLEDNITSIYCKVFISLAIKFNYENDPSIISEVICKNENELTILNISTFRYIHIKNNEGRNSFDLVNKSYNQEVLITLNNPSVDVKQSKTKINSLYEENLSTLSSITS
ncbi:hypothetical protein H8356DRAFT_1362062 [Neocallimastix lanati (nom. inval.)]|nr:hypothetical protein H8356DRAFT_1362062 [Neocallimastix sp. JGI-2020a]